MPWSARNAAAVRSLVIFVVVGCCVGCLGATVPETGDEPPVEVPDPGAIDGGGGDAATGDEGGGRGDASSADLEAADPPGNVDPRFARLVQGGFWDGFFTGSPSKLTEDAEGFGVNAERNATIRWLGGVAGFDDPDAYLNEGRIRFRVKVNAAGLETGGGGKHLINLASTALSRGRRDGGPVTRVEIANPGDAHPRFVLHNYVDGQGGARDLGDLPVRFEPDQWVEIDWSWRFDGRFLRMTLNGAQFEAELAPGSEGPGRYWGSGHVETPSGGGTFTFSRMTITRQ